MIWSPTVHAALLLAATGLAVWAAAVSRGRRTVSGSAVFGWLMLAIAHWTFLAALHTLVPSVAGRILIAKVQYLGIAAVPPLWLLFTSEYARAAWVEDRMLRSLLWAIPAVTVVLAFTNEAHGLIWTGVERSGPGPLAPLVYRYGPWFWMSVVYNYGVLALGTIMLLRALRQSPLPFRRQTAAMLLGALLPWAGNALYLGRLWPAAGYDPTPIGFALSGACLLWGLYRHRLLGVVPIARDLVVDSLDQGVVVLDLQRHIVDMNAAARRISGCSDEALGRPVEEAIPWWAAAAAEGYATAAEPAVVTIGNRAIEVEITAVRDGQDRFAGWLLTMKDTTARRTAEFERRALERRVLEQQRVESLSVLAGGIAHDFNNLLTGILGNADLLALGSGPGSPQRRQAEEVILSAQRAADLVSKMLAYAGEGRVVPQPVDLDVLIREMIDLLRASVARHCTLRHESSGALPPVHVDPAQVRQVFLNLVVNAAEAVDEGQEIAIGTSVANLSSRDLARMTYAATARPGPHVGLSVRDSGPGMTADTLGRIFDPFYSTKATGRGLGLAAVQGIVRSHRGALHVESTPGRGAAFTVWLPVWDTSPGVSRETADVSEGEP